jgi:hypothetical protein
MRQHLEHRELRPYSNQFGSFDELQRPASTAVSSIALGSATATTGSGSNSA